MTEQAKAIDVMRQDVYRDVLSAVDGVVEKHGSDVDAMSIYLSLRVIAKVFEDELGIDPVEVELK